VWSVLSFSRIRRREQAPDAPERRHLVGEIRAGLEFVFRNVYLRALALQAFVWNFFNQIVLVVVMLYVLRSLHLSPAFLGAYFSIGSAGGVVGALVAARYSERVPFGRAIVVAMCVDSAAPVLVPAASGPTWRIGALMFPAAFLWGFGIILSNVNVVALRQSVTPDRLLGRMTASYRLLSWGGIPIGSAVAGVLAGWLGARTALFVGAFGLPVSLLPIFLSPLPRLTAAPAPDESVAGTAETC
jgi:MFS family permease